MRVVLVGATGLVGTKMLQVLQERNFPVTELIPVASARSVGKTVHFQGKDWTVVSMEDGIAAQADVALFSAGGSTSLEFAPKYAAAGTTVIDNSSAWRMSPDHKLVVPEINANQLTAEDKIIANPNCSTIQMVLALKPLHDAYTAKRVIVSTYQSITGTGVKAVQQMEDERNGVSGDKAYPHTIDRNCLPHCDVFQENGYTKEEMKLAKETCKILGSDDIKVTATAVRVPVVGGHSEAINVEFEQEFDLDEVRAKLAATPGIEVVDDPFNNLYPMPLSAHEQDAVFVGRIRRDETQPRTLNMWVVSDNLRKGAATNAVQIAEHLLRTQ
ncbi:MAG: aspartate-semialdehyde dehydrogenase [Flavobacteriales bacterium]